MNTQMPLITDADRPWLFQAGGIAAVTLGLAYCAIIVLYVPMGAPPMGAEPRLAYMAGNTTAWWGILSLSVLTDFLFVPITVALFIALKGFNRNA
ncbi:MAG: hypothetical protein RL367_662, partial [Pseudomonadota bacterium]